MTKPSEPARPVELRPGVYQIPAQRPGSHVYLIKGSSKNVLIDTGITANYPSLASQLASLGVKPEDVHFVILTHEHFDHIGATTFFDRAVVAAHALAANKISLQDEFVTLNKYHNVESAPFHAHIWLTDGIVIDLGDYKLQIIHTPGHTSGCLCVYELKEKLLFSGDAVFAGGLLSDIAESGNISDYVNSLQRLSNLKIKELYPGHGHLSTTPEEDICRGMDIARTMMAETMLLFESLTRNRDKAGR